MNANLAFIIGTTIGPAGTLHQRPRERPAPHNPYLPVRFAELQRNYFRADVQTLPRCGHWPMID